MDSAGISEMSHTVLAVITASLDKYGRPPTLREIAKAVGISSTNGVRYHLALLEKRGLIERDRRITRGIRVIKNGGNQ